MILSSTIRALAAKGANIYLVEAPAWVIPANHFGLHQPEPKVVPAYGEYFASRPAAAKRALDHDALHDALKLKDAPHARIRAVPADSIDPWTLLPKWAEVAA